MRFRAFLVSKQFMVSAVTMILIIFVLVAINRTFITFTRQALIQNQIEKMYIQATYIKIAIQLSRKGEQHVIDLMGRNFWSGTMDTSSSNPENVDLWGYYYDGTTNYIVNPHVHDTSFFQSYQNETGVDAFINAIIKETQPITEEVTVFNPPTFLKEQEQFQKDGIVWYSDREILFGTYTLQVDEDKEMVREAYRTKKEVTLETIINGKPMLKTYIPLELEFPVVVGITSDITPIHDCIVEFTNRMYFVSLLSSLAALVILYLIFRYFNRNKEEAVRSVQDVFVENIDQLFTSIKEQRHDFNNHIATIQSLVASRQYEELQKYTSELVGEAAFINDIININSPVLSALIQAKITQAIDRKIQFEFHIINFDNISLNAVKSTDLVKIVSNLIDNAFEAVESLEEPDRYVLLEGRREGDMICFSVFNKGEPIPESQVAKLFEKGYSTKKHTGQNAGLGLYIVQKIVKKYNGRITVHPKEDGNIFKVVLPL